jgi:peptide/nickel transport system substrate-binding protein
MGSDFLQIMRLVQEGPWTLDFDGNVIFLLATGWEEHDDFHWTIHFRDDVYFSNGNKFVAEDFVFSLGVWRDAGVSGSGRVQDVDFENTRAIDETTVEMRWTGIRWNHYYTIADMAIYNKESYDEEQASGNPIGTGPFVVTDYVVNSHVFLERRDAADYWGELPPMKNINFRVLAETSQRVNALETGLVNIAPVAAIDADYVDGLPGISVRERVSARWVHIGFNPTPPGILHNPEARYAIAHAINVEPIINIVYHGRAIRMDWPISNAALDKQPHFANGHSTYATGYNVDVARDLANRTGLTGQNLTIITNGAAEPVQIAEMIQSMLNDIGVNLTINNYDPAGFQAASRETEGWDLMLAEGFLPTLDSGRSMTNFMRFNAVFNIPGSWESAEWFVDPMGAPQVMIDGNLAVRQRLTAEIFDRYTRGCLYFGLAEFLALEAFADFIDTSNYVLNLDGTPMWWSIGFK